MEKRAGRRTKTKFNTKGLLLFNKYFGNYLVGAYLAVAPEI